MTGEDLAWADEIIAMDDLNAARLEEQFPGVSGRICVSILAPPVSDPYRGNADDYREALDAVRVACRA